MIRAGRRSTDLTTIVIHENSEFAQLHGPVLCGNLKEVWFGSTEVRSCPVSSLSQGLVGRLARGQGRQGIHRIRVSLVALDSPDFRSNWPS